MKDHTGLSLGYRIFWRLNYVGVTFFGPAQGRAEGDPKCALRAERAEKVAAAYRARGQEVPAEVTQVIDAGGKKPDKVRKVSTKDRGPFAL